jgi:hypothetical protein
MPELVLPMSVLTLWTLVVLTLIPIARVRAVRAGRAHVKDFRYGESGNVPGDVSLPNRDYMNLLELPVLFYVACLTVIATNRVFPGMYELAWAFVGLRIVHSLIHLTYNNVLHRLIAFAAGVFVVLAMWVRLLVWVLERMCWLQPCT